MGLPPKEVRDLAYTYAADVGVVVGAEARANQMLSEDWWSGLQSRLHMRSFSSESLKRCL